MRAVMVCRLRSLSKCRGMVGAAGFEPATWSTQNSRATRTRYAPALPPSLDTRFGLGQQARRKTDRSFKSTALVQFEDGSQQVLHRRLGRQRGRPVVAGVGIERDARVLVAERLPGFGVDDGAGGLFLELAGTQALRIGCNDRGFAAQRIVGV